jgi:hypothetical protein
MSPPDLRLLGDALLYIQLPLSFTLALYGRPTAEFLLPRASNETGAYTEEHVVRMAVPCIAVATLLLYAGLAARARQRGAGGDYDGDGDPLADALFWGAAGAFVLLRNMLLLEAVDGFAIALLTALWLAAEYTACRAAAGPPWLCLRISAVMVLFAATGLLVVLVCLALDSAAEAYVLALCVVADGVLVIGHTWDYPESTAETVANCRLAYMCILQAALPCAIAANAGLL